MSKLNLKKENRLNSYKYTTEIAISGLNLYHKKYTIYINEEKLQFMVGGNRKTNPLVQ